MPIFPQMKVKAPSQSHHNRSHYHRTSMAPGALIPIYCRPVVPGDDIALEYESLVNTQALLSPLYGSYKIQIDTFFAGDSLYCPQLWRNGTMRQPDGTLHQPYPTFKLLSTTSGTNPIKFTSVHESSLLSYLGFNPGYAAPSTNWPSALNTVASNRDFNAVPLLMYLDIFRHWYANRQELSAPFIVDGGKFNSSGAIRQFTLSELDDFFEYQLPTSTSASKDITKLISEIFGDDVFRAAGANSGVLLRTFRPDRMNVILNKDFAAKNVSTVQVSTVGDSFQVDQLVTAKKLWDSRNKDAMSSGTFKDWVRLHYGVTPKIMDDMPTFLGSTSSDIMFEDIRATTAVYDPVNAEVSQHLGDKGSSAKGYCRSRRHRVVADRPGYVMAIASIVPLVDYYQNLERYTMFTDLQDTFRPEYNNIGLQDVLVSDINADNHGVGSVTELSDPSKYSLGKQPAWIEYMTAVNKIRGSFCSTERSWVLARNMFVEDGVDPISDTSISAYVYPNLWNQPFAVQSVTAQNFLVQFFIKDVVRSSVAKRLLPKF